MLTEVYIELLYLTHTGMAKIKILNSIKLSVATCRSVAQMQRKLAVCCKAGNILLKYLHLLVFFDITSLMLFANNTLHGAQLAFTNSGSKSNNTVNMPKLLCYAHISQFVLLIFVIVKFRILL